GAVRPPSEDARVDRVSLLERLRRVPGVRELPVLGRFDPDDEAVVDDVARALLARFREASDGEAFTLLFELTHPRLSRLAEQIVRKLEPTVDPEELAASFMTRLFADVRARSHPPVRRFL